MWFWGQGLGGAGFGRPAAQPTRPERGVYPAGLDNMRGGRTGGWVPARTCAKAWVRTVGPRRGRDERQGGCAGGGLHPEPPRGEAFTQIFSRRVGCFALERISCLPSAAWLVKIMSRKCPENGEWTEGGGSARPNGITTLAVLPAGPPRRPWKFWKFLANRRGGETAPRGGGRERDRASDRAVAFGLGHSPWTIACPTRPHTTSRRTEDGSSRGRVGQLTLAACTSACYTASYVGQGDGGRVLCCPSCSNRSCP